MTPEQWVEFRKMGRTNVLALFKEAALPEDTLRAAREWISEDDRLSESSQSEQMSIARSAKDAAWEAAQAAHSANAIAKSALAMAAIAIIISIIALFVGKGH